MCTVVFTMGFAVFKPKKGDTFELPLGQQAEFGKEGFDHAIAYCGMVSPTVYSLRLRDPSVPSFASNERYSSFNLYLPVPKPEEKQNLDDILERTALVEVVKVEPRSITLKYVS